MPESAVFRPARMLLVVATVVALALAGVIALPTSASAAPGTVNLSGTILDTETTAPVAGLPVSVYAASESTSRTSYVRGAITNSAGVYNIDDLPAGTYVIELGSQYTRSGYLTTFVYSAPGASIKQATRIGLTAETELVDGAVTRSGRYTGRVVDPEGAPVAGVYLSLTASSQAAPDAPDGVFSGANGTFELDGLSSGSFTLSLDANDATGTRKLASRNFEAPPVTAGAAATPVGDIALSWGNSLSGVVTSPPGAALANVYIEARVKGADGELTAVDYSGTTKTGAYSFDRLPSGEIFIHLSAPGYPDQFAGGTNDAALAVPFVIGEGGTSTSRDIRLFAGGSITGIVKNAKTGKGLAGIEVDAVKLGTDGEPDYSATGSGITSKTGAFVVPGLGAGQYLVSYNAAPTEVGLAVSTTSMRVYLADKATVKKDATLAPLAKVSGVVTSAAAVNLADIRVVAHKLGSGATTNDVETVTSDTGAYGLYLPAGEWTLRFSDPDAEFASLYLGATSTPQSSTTVTAAGLPLAGRDISLTTFDGGIDLDLIGQFGDLAGTVHLTGADGQFAENYSDDSDLQSLFPLTNLAPGSYELTIVAADADSTFTAAVGPIDVDGAMVDAGSVDLGVGTLTALARYNHSRAPNVVTDGSPQVGEDLVVDPGDWTRSGQPVITDDFTYQWLRNGKAIPAATSEWYTVQGGDAGARLSARVSPEVGSTVTTEPTVVVAPGAAPVVDTLPAVIGKRNVGQKLTVSSGTWDTTELTFGYRWTRVLHAEPDIVTTVGTAASYTPVKADAAANISLIVEVTTQRRGFESAVQQVVIADLQPAIALKQTKKSVVTKLAAGSFRVTSGIWSQSGVTVTHRATVYDEADAVLESWDIQPVAGSATISTEHVSQRLVVDVTATKTGFAPSTVRLTLQKATAPIEWIDPEISGDPQIGRVLSVSGMTQPAAQSVSYQWILNGQAVKGATKATFTPTAAGTVTVALIATREGYASSARVVAGPVFVPVASGGFEGAVAVYGSQSVGRVLTAATTTPFAPAPTAVSYQWLRGASLESATAISKATKSTYTLTAADKGKFVAVTVTLKRAGFTTTILRGEMGGTVSDYPIQAVRRAVIASAVKVGSPVTVVAGTWDVATPSVTYAWYRNGAPIVGATGPSYTPTAEDLDEELSVLATAAKAGFPTGSAQSNRVVVAPGAAPVASKIPVLTVGGKTPKSVALSATISSSVGTWSTPGVTYSYEWQSSANGGADWMMAGATTKAFFVDPDQWDTDVTGNTATLFRVKVTAVKSGYLNGSSFSKPLPLG